MVLSLGPVIVGNELGLYALLALIPFLLLYLIRPRLQQLAIPSVMFLFREAGVARYSKFFRNFIRDWLFLIQLLAILSLIGALLGLFFWYDHEVGAENTVIVLDVSASSQVREGSATRFEIARERAKELLGSTNTIILAKEIPLIGAKDVSSRDAEAYLESITPRDTPTRLGDAIILAGEVLSEKEGHVIVLSDFINTGGQDPNTAKLVLESKGILVDFITTVESDIKNNIGFIDASVSNERSVVYVKNYGSSTAHAIITAANLRDEFDIDTGQVHPFAFETPAGITTVTLSPDDAFMADNMMRISGPAEQKTNILLITNNQSVFLENALKASTFTNVHVAVPPIVPTENIDIFVLHNIHPAEILPGTLEDIEEQVRGGKTLVIHAQSDTNTIDYKNLFPYTGHIGADNVGQGPVILEQVTRYSKNIDFGLVNHALNVSGEQNGGSGMTTIASVNGAPVLSVGMLDSGTIVYMGFLEEASDFRFSPSYPIFWHELLKFLTHNSDVRSLNFPTGQSLILDGIETVETVHTPRDIIRASSIILDYAGTYRINERTIVASLLSEQESAINAGSGVGQNARKYILTSVKEAREYDLEIALIIATCAILFFELIFIKWQGDV